MVGIVTFRTLADGIVSEQQAFNSGPVDDTVDFLHSFDFAVTIHRIEEGDVGKGKRGFCLLKAHSSSKGCSWREYGLITRENQALINNFNMVGLHNPKFSRRKSLEFRQSTGSCAKVSK